MHAASENASGRVVQGTGSRTRLQGSVYARGISAETVGARAVFLGRVTIPPQGRTRAHLHERHESAFDLLRGDAVELCTGPRLEGERGHAARAGRARAMSACVIFDVDIRDACGPARRVCVQGLEGSAP